MKINFDQKIINIITGNPFQFAEGKDSLKDVCILVLSQEPSTKELDATDSYKRYTLALQIIKGGEVDLSVEDLTYIKGLAGKTLFPMVYGPVADALEGK